MDNQTSAIFGTAIFGLTVFGDIQTQAARTGFEGGPGMVVSIVEGGIVYANPWNRRNAVTTTWTRRTGSLV